MDILMVVPKYERSFLDPYYCFPLGLAYISSTLKHNGHDVDVLNLNSYYGYIQDRDWAPVRMLMERAIRKKEYDVVCTGGLSPDFDHVQAIVAAAKALDPALVTVVGGGLISSLPDCVLEPLGADFGIVGEGEETIIELLHALQQGETYPASVAGLVHLDRSGKAVVNKPRISCNDLNTMPFPDYEGFDLEGHLCSQMPTDHHFWYPYDNPRCVPIVASRSCVHRCTFCYHPAGQKYRQRTLDSVFSEIDYLIANYRINMVNLWDELLGANKQRLVEFSERIASYGIRWACQLHLSNIDPDLLALMKRSGCMLLSYGLESASEPVLQSMQKKLTVPVMETGLKASYEAGLQVQGNFIFGDKGETLDTALETMNWWINHKQYQINLARVIPYPGSELFNHACSTGLVPDKIAALKDECRHLHSINLSSMTEKESDYIDYLTGLYTRTIGRIPARVLAARKSGVSPTRGPIYSLTITCPRCDRSYTANNMHVKTNPWAKSMLRVRLGCRECGQRYDIFPFELEEKILDTLHAKDKAATVAIFKSDDKAEFLLQNSINIKERTRFLIEDDFSRLPLHKEGAQVIQLFNRIGLVEKGVDIVILTSKPAPAAARELSRLQELGVSLLDVSEFFPDNIDLKDEQQIVSYMQEKFSEANAAMAEGKPEAAFFEIHSLIEMFHDFAPLHKALAEVAYSMGDLNTALDAAGTASLMAPQDPAMAELLQAMTVSLRSREIAMLKSCYASRQEKVVMAHA
ncbi:B12-binding domain-containing radical SAM protein [Citrifermentans bremense]|uniref:B12-binding domain-containing radical SAM protein n=1 Tax=Citrifermentans bremense TaxID=60035 RepID=UPI000403B2BE|nr:radical SAM protein [Citrifermentans bremense]